MTFTAELKRRKLAQWTVAYLAGAWVLLQVLSLLSDSYDWPPTIMRITPVLLVGGLLITIVLAWFHGGTGRQRPVPIELALLFIVLLITGAGAAVIASGDDLVHEPADGAVVEQSVAVLPFRDMSPAQDQEYLADGITEEILNALSQVGGLRVPARTTSFSFKGSDIPVPEIARQLRVAHVLEGSVRKQGNDLRITAQLVDARNDQHLWSQNFERSVDDAFAVQDEIAKSVVDALKLHLNSGPLLQQATASGRAHELYLKGLYFWHRRRGDELPLALENFRAATRADPQYARAWAGLALTYAVMPLYVRYDHREAARQGKETAARALQLDPEAADAYAALSQIALELEYDWATADRNIRRALQLAPNYATAHQWRAEVLFASGRYEEALAETERGLDLDPLSTVLQHERAWALSLTGRPAEAYQTYRAIMKRDPQFEPARDYALLLALRLKRYDEALQLARDTVTRATIAALKDENQKAAVLQLLGNAKTRERVPFATIAYAYAELGQPDSALTLLIRAAEKWEPSLWGALTVPSIRQYAAHPLYQEFQRKIGFAGQTTGRDLTR